jgi:outer membrane immunogenic protein
MRGSLVALLAGALGFGAVQAASAADMPVKAPMAPVAAPYNWNGLYLGVNGGYGWSTTNHTDTFGVSTGDFAGNGGLFGVTYGANWQFGRWVLGFEGDFDLANINANLTTAGPPLGLCSINGGTNCFTNLKNFSTDRLRAGYDLDGWLLFATGGFGFGQVNAGQTPCGPVPINIPAGVGGGNSCNQMWRSGWVAGAGVERMFAPNWSAKLEYLHYDFGNDIQYTPTTILGGSSVHVLVRGDMVRLGVNYHFNLFH